MPSLRTCRQYAAVALTAAVVVACAKDRALPSKQDSGRDIGFGTTDATSRAAVTTSLRKIGVFCYSHTGSFGDDLPARVPDYFLNQAVADIPGNGTWTYNGITRYWPTNGTTNLSFFAYAPYVDVENTFTLYPASATDAGAPTITYNVPDSVLGQIDLMWNNRLDMTYATSNNGQVEFTMDHALTRIDVQVKLDDAEQGRPFVVQFNKLTIQNVVGGGTLDLSKGPSDADLWTTTRPADDSGWASYTITPGGHGGMADVAFDARNTAPAAGDTDPWNFNSLLKAGQYFMLIPQDISDQGDGLTPAQLVVDYTYTNVLSGDVVDQTDTLALARPMLSTWLPGMGITYQLTVSLMSGTAIEFDIEGFVHGQPWIPANDPNGLPGTPGGPISGTVN